MPHALAFFPWIALDQPLTIGDLRLLPYHAGGRKNTLPHVTQADLHAIFRSYRNRPREPVRQGTIIEVGDWHSGMEMDMGTVERLYRARDALAISALSTRRLFQGHNNYVNTDAFTLIVQNFTPGEAHYFAYSTRRRDGATSNLWSNSEFSFQRPLHVSTGVRPDVDTELALALMAVPKEDPIVEAVREFNAANTDSDRVPVHVELVMVKTALEWLLGIDERRASLTKALLARFPKSAAATPHGPLTARWIQENPTDDRLLAAWALDFCKVRNSAAHGSGQRGAPRLVWDHDRHLAFASILFTLVVKQVLAERTVYMPTDRDRDEFNHIEDFLAIDPFGPEIRRGWSPWAEVQLKIRTLGFGRSSRNAILDGLGTHELSLDANRAP
jgi:hypothetical protein